MGGSIPKEINLKPAILLFVTWIGVGPACFTNSATAAEQPTSVVAAKSADAFVDAIGMNTHFREGAGSIYAQEALPALLGELGIRHIRDAANAFGPARIAPLYDRYGIRSNIIVDIVHQGVGFHVTALQDDWAESIEGPNEPDFALLSYGGFKDAGRDTFNDFRANHAFQTDLYNAVKANPKTANKLVMSSAMAFAIHASFVAGPPFEARSLHFYSPDGDVPDYWRLHAWGLPNAKLISPDRELPLYVTETGYHTGKTTRGSISFLAQKKYTPRLLATYFNLGVKRTWLYELADQGTDLSNKEKNYGIIANDLTPKPAYTALKNLIGILKERTWNIETKKWSDLTVNPGSLDFTLAGDTRTVRHTLLQKSNGDFYLLLWNEVPSYRKGDIEVLPLPLTVNVNIPIAGAEYYTLDSTSPKSSSPAGVQSIAIDVPDEVVILRLTPAEVQPLVAAVTIAASNASVDEQTANKPATFTVSRTGDTSSAISVAYSVNGTAKNGVDYARLSGEVTIPANATSAVISVVPTADSDVEGNERVVLTLEPGKDYALAAKRSAQVDIVDFAPNLIVTNILMDSTSPTVDKPLVFSAVVKNVGTAPVSSTSLYVGFYVDNLTPVISAADVPLTTLAPGESVTVRANIGGADNSGRWTATAGEHVITAWVDANKTFWHPEGTIAELSDLDNQFFKRISVSPSPGAP